MEKIENRTILELIALYKQDKYGLYTSLNKEEKASLISFYDRDQEIMKIIYDLRKVPSMFLGFENNESCFVNFTIKETSKIYKTTVDNSSTAAIRENRGARFSNFTIDSYTIVGSCPIWIVKEFAIWCINKANFVIDEVEKIYEIGNFKDFPVLIENKQASLIMFGKKVPINGAGSRVDVDLKEGEQIINCTPHKIDILELSFEPSGILPRVSMILKEAKTVLGLPATIQEVGEVEGLPEFKKDTFLIVSGMVFGASNRKDLLAPDTGATAIRNEKGHIVGVTRFLRK